MAISENLVGTILAGALALAVFTKPDQAAHEHKMKEVMQSYVSKEVSSGSWSGIFNAAKAQTADWLRSGRYEQGIFSSGYEVTVLGQKIAQCTGALGVVVCYPKSK